MLSRNCRAPDSPFSHVAARTVLGLIWSRRVPRVVLLIGAGLCWAGNVAARTLNAADKPNGKTGVASSGSCVKADPAGDAFQWPATLKLSIAQGAQAEELLFPSTMSPFCLAGLKAYESDRSELYDLTTGKRVG